MKLAINRLGLGPCHHVEPVLHDIRNQVPLWNAAVDGRPDWQAVYRGFPPGLSQDQLARAYVAHNDAVKSTIPSQQLLVFEVKNGWGPLCEFLGVDAPDKPFPRTNHRAEFWDRVTGKI